jgi:hypothetical protein
VNGRGRGHAGRRLLSTAGMALGSGPQVAAFYRTLLWHLSLAWARKWASWRLESEPRGAERRRTRSPRSAKCRTRACRAGVSIIRPIRGWA